jgi:dTMP kinase
MRDALMSNGFLVSFVGIDGSGKTTQAKILVDSLSRNGFNTSYVWCRWEPFFLKYFIKMWRDITRKNTIGEGSYKIEIKNKKQKLLSNPLFRWLWMLVFLIDYGFQVFIRIHINLMKGQMVISDRIFYDSIIDQAINLGQKKDLLLNNLNSFWIKVIFPIPNIVIYIDCPENIAFSRTDDDLDIEYLKDRRKLYLELADRFGWFKIDGTLPVDVVANQVREVVYKKLAI